MAKPGNPSDMPPWRRRAAWAVFLAGLLLIGVAFAPFALDPMGWLDIGASTVARAGGAEYLVLLEDHEDRALRDAFFRAHPAFQVTHEGKALPTITVRVPDAAALAELKLQPFVALVSRGGIALCE